MIADATGSQTDALRGFIGNGLHTALDVGCGTGEKTALIARDIGTTIGIDPDTGQIRQAHARHGGERLCFRVARAEALCFCEAAFEAVLFNESLHHVPVDRQAEALREAHRVLKPRCGLLITEPIHGSGSLGRELKLYLEEKTQEQKAVEAIEAVMAAEFELRAQTVIRIEYHFAGFEEFYGFYAMTRPEAGSDMALKEIVRAGFERCPRKAQGHTVIDYAASVWHLLKW